MNVVTIMVPLEWQCHSKVLPRHRISQATIERWILVPPERCRRSPCRTGLSRRSALQLDNMDEYVQHFLAALEDSRVVDRFRLIMQPSISESLDSVTGTLKATVADLQQTVSALQSIIKKRDDEILTLRREVTIFERTTMASSSTVVELQSECWESQKTHLAPQTTCCSICATKPLSCGLRWLCQSLAQSL